MVHAPAIHPTAVVDRSARVGEGVSKAASEYGRIIADLVRQQAPVLEVGPTKDVTVVLTEGVWLEIKSSREGGS